MSVNTFFEHIYCINLDRRPDRWERCQTEFAKFGIEGVERFSATDGQLHTAAPRLARGAYGVLDTHRRILSNAMQNGYSNILILEDDVAFNDNFNEYFEEIESQVPDDWDILYLGSNIQNWQPRPVTKNIHIAFGVLALHSVGIAGKAYSNILRSLDELTPVDVQYARLAMWLKMYNVIPRMTYQQPGWSDIEQMHVDYNWFLRDEA